MCWNAHSTEMRLSIIRLMDGLELRRRRDKLKIIRRYFANLLGVTADKLYEWESSRAAIPSHVEQAVKNIEEKLNKRKNESLQIIDRS